MAATMSQRRCAPVCVFAKPPLPGQVKTRLGQTQGARRAAALAGAFIRDTLTGLARVPWATPVVATTGPLDGVVAGVPQWLQGDGDLGARLERVFARALGGADRAYALGADSPGLPPAFLDEADRRLRHADAVLGPADDGGFYLLGLRRCPPGLLRDLPWSAPTTRAAVEARLTSAGLRVAHAPSWFDVDDEPGLRRLAAMVRARRADAPATQRLLDRPLSIVIPTLGEAARIGAQVERVRDLPGVHEVIVVDGGSEDATVALAAAAGAAVLAGPRGRGPQLNVGARHATGEIVVFVHADVELPRDVAAQIGAALADAEIVGGAFRTRTVADRPHWFAPLLPLADLRSRYTRLPYGDQALFVRAAAFDAVGGYPEQPLFEDVEFARRLRRRGRLHTVSATVRVSGRRFLARPLYWSAAMNVLPALYRLGVSAETLARWYRPVR